MFGNKKRDKEDEVKEFAGVVLYFYGNKKKELEAIDDLFTKLFRKLKAIEEYLGIEYQEKTETTKGYVKKGRIKLK